MSLCFSEIIKKSKNDLDKDFITSLVKSEVFALNKKTLKESILNQRKFIEKVVDELLENKYQQSSLYEKLVLIEEKFNFDKQIIKFFHDIRKIGNEGAHINEKDYSQEEILKSLSNCYDILRTVILNNRLEYFFYEKEELKNNNYEFKKRKVINTTEYYEINEGVEKPSKKILLGLGIVAAFFLGRESVK
ncbi:DUF4145 domain-containing protein [Fusobacterium varium]|uniref:DUF4145 domain-containing protein n=1 Tax=Fusobacterium varium TaxID=856 RepID=UPI0032BFB1CE